MCDVGWVCQVYVCACVCVVVLCDVCVYGVCVCVWGVIYAPGWDWPWKPSAVRFSSNP